MDNASVEITLTVYGTSCKVTSVSQEDALAKLLQVSFLKKNILKISATQCSLVHFERSAQAVQRIIGSINFNTDKISKPYLIVFLNHLYKLKREDKLCQKQINSLLLLTTPSKIPFFLSSSCLDTLSHIVTLAKDLGDFVHNMSDFCSYVDFWRCK